MVTLSDIRNYSNHHEFVAAEQESHEDKDEALQTILDIQLIKSLLQADYAVSLVKARFVCRGQNEEMLLKPRNNRRTINNSSNHYTIIHSLLKRFT